MLNPRRRGMRVPRIYVSSSDVYTQNNYLNDSDHQVGRGCEFHGNTGASQMLIGNKVIPNPKWAGDATFTRIRERVRRL